MADAGGRKVTKPVREAAALARDGLSGRKIAEAQGCSEGTARRRLATARAAGIETGPHDAATAGTRAIVAPSAPESRPVAAETHTAAPVAPEGGRLIGIPPSEAIPEGALALDAVALMRAAGT